MQTAQYIKRDLKHTAQEMTNFLSGEKFKILTVSTYCCANAEIAVRWFWVQTSKVIYGINKKNQ